MIYVQHPQCLCRAFVVWVVKPGIFTGSHDNRSLFQSYLEFIGFLHWRLHYRTTTRCTRVMKGSNNSEITRRSEQNKETTVDDVFYSTPLPSLCLICHRLHSIHTSHRSWANYTTHLKRRTLLAGRTHRLTGYARSTLVTYASIGERREEGRVLVSSVWPPPRRLTRALLATHILLLHFIHETFWRATDRARTTQRISNEDG
ncbi:hypothetical protein B0H19DRAFT_64288 [Mycena capillaripes]|nr:hypothetical protein B0H19DRAFT_64288 [Mycena capillaripes]